MQSLHWTRDNISPSSGGLSLVPDELLPIHGCQNLQRAGDVIFVHGLNGNARDYWCYEGKPENYWPAWLGEDLPDAGIWSLGYENAAFRSRRLSLLRRSGYRGFAMPLSDRAKGVLLQLEVAGLGERPLVFVAHSMGGLLVKQLLRTANENPAQKPWTAVLKNTRGVCFIATPHVSSDLAKWASYFRTILGTNISTRELEPHGSLLRELNEFYRNFVTREGVNIKTVSFFEKRPLFGDTLVVAEGDADPGIPQAGLHALGEDHLSICKPSAKMSVIHMKLVDFIRNGCFQLQVAPSLSLVQMEHVDRKHESHNHDFATISRQNPALFVFLIDCSASMAGNLPNTPNKSRTRNYRIHNESTVS